MKAKVRKPGNRFVAILAMTAILSGISVISSADAGTARYYVSAAASDAADGTREHPFTLEQARAAVREKIAEGLTQNVEVVLFGGVYELDQTFALGPEDSGNNGFTVTYRGHENEMPTLSAGRKIGGVSILPNGMWKTVVSETDTIMELYVNGSRAYRASVEKKVYGMEDYDDPDTAYPYDGFYISKEILEHVAHPEDLTIRQSKGWKGHLARVAGVESDPGDSSRSLVLMNPWYSFFRSYGRDGHGLLPEYGFRLENALEFLDNPGEFYFDKRSHALYYLPRDGETPENAAVYAPRLRRVLEVSGTGAQKAENIKFEKLQFAHAAYTTPEENGYSHGQASENLVALRTDEINTPAGVEVTAADRIQFHNCVVYGMGGAGIALGHSVTNSEIVGCAVYDTGESGVVTGYSTGKYYQDERADMVTKSSWSFSDVGLQPVFKITEAEGGRWSPDNDVANGKIPWFSFAFDEAVAIDEIVLSANGSPGDIPEKRNFEVIASNDAGFEEYDVLHTQGSAGYAEARLRILVNSPKKYRYLQIRKTAAEAFSLDVVHIYTDDLPAEKWQRPENITLRDNYITRTGNAYYGAIGMCLYSTENLVVENNEIGVCSYSAISAGWDGELTQGMKIRNNYIHDYMYEPCDGGGIYTLGVQNGAEITGNYIKNQWKPNAAIYTDLTSAGFHIYDNVFENVPNNYWTGLTGERGIVIGTAYSTTDRALVYTQEDGYDTDIVYEEPLLFAAGSPPQAAQDIIDRAGISAVNRWIKDLVPAAAAYYEKDRLGMYSSFWAYAGEYDPTGASMLDLAKTIARNGEVLLELGSFGSQSGQYSAASGEKLRDSIGQLGALDRVQDQSFAGRTERLWHYYVAYEECISSLNGTEQETMWSNWYGQRPEQQGEMVRLASSEAPYVYLEEGGSFSCDFSVRRTEGAFETKILLDCPRPELLLGGYEDANSHFEIALQKETVRLAYVERGVEHVICEGDIPPDEAMAWHRLEMKTHPLGDYKKITVNIDGREIISQLCLSYHAKSSGYFGILTPLTDFYIRNISVSSSGVLAPEDKLYVAEYDGNAVLKALDVSPLADAEWTIGYPYGLDAKRPAGDYVAYTWGKEIRPLSKPVSFTVENGAVIAERRNAAKNKRADTITGATMPGTQPHYVLDGNAETYWMSQPTYTELKIDLGRLYHTEELRLWVPEEVLQSEAGLRDGRFHLTLLDEKGQPVSEVGWVTPAAGENLLRTNIKCRYLLFRSWSETVYGFSEVQVITSDRSYD